MLVKRIIASVMTAIMAASFVAFLNPDEVFATSENLTSLYADFTEINFKGRNGGDIILYVDGSSVGVRSDCVSTMNFRICDEDYHAVFEERMTGNSSYDVSDILEVGNYYYVDMAYTADGQEYREWDSYITLKEDGNVTFLKSLCYDFNVERCSELWTDAQSLAECLEPQNDVECDDPKVISRAASITAGCTNDWEKAYAIYSYIVEEFAYDYVQLDDVVVDYQDDALTLMRREVAICEGMGNTFVALCRAAGVPAAVSFGIGEGNAENMMFDRSYLTDENPNHAWACVCLDGNWYHVDPTWDCDNKYQGSSFANGSRTEGNSTYDWFLLPLEVFSMTHKICDADTIHGIESSGSCGSNSTYEISRDGTITFYGSGRIKLPDGVNGFRRIEFAEGSNITTIGAQCFIDCDIITSVVLPDTVTTIEYAAFYTCEDLEYVIIPDSVTSIGDYAFGVCDELAYIYVPDSVTDIGDYAFDGDGRLIISVPSGVSGFVSDYDINPWRVIVR